MQYLQHLWSEQQAINSNSSGDGGMIGQRENRTGEVDDIKKKPKSVVYKPVYSIVAKMRHNSSFFYSSPILSKWVRGKHA
jgi:hypothetical protein